MSPTGLPSLFPEWCLHIPKNGTELTLQRLVCTDTKGGYRTLRMTRLHRTHITDFSEEKKRKGGGCHSLIQLYANWISTKKKKPYGLSKRSLICLKNQQTVRALLSGYLFFSFSFLQLPPLRYCVPRFPLRNNIPIL